MALSVELASLKVEWAKNRPSLFYQTGAGKTYTIAGDTQRYDQRGIIPRAVHYLFSEIDLREDREVTVRCSYLEIYNEVCT